MAIAAPKKTPYKPCATLKKIRLKRSLTQEDILVLIAEMGIEPFNAAFISGFETGRRKPWGRAIALISQALEMQPIEVFPEYVKPD